MLIEDLKHEGYRSTMAKSTGDSIMNQDSVFIYSDELLKYKFSDHHPFNQMRLNLTLDLLMKMQCN